MKNGDGYEIRTGAKFAAKAPGSSFHCCDRCLSVDGSTDLLKQLFKIVFQVRSTP